MKDNSRSSALIDQEPVIEVETFETAGSAPRRFSLSRARLVFLLVVCLPTLLTALYLGLFASARYESASKFVVRSQETRNMGGLSMILSTVASTTSFENAYAVIAWIQSHDALDELDRDLDYKKMVSDPSIDILSRAGGVWGDGGQDLLLRYYNNMVQATLDTRSGIVELTTTAFTPEDAQRINQALIRAAEALVNRMNAREHASRLEEAAKEVSLAEQNLLAIDQKVQQARIATGIIDPTLETTTGTSTMLALQQALVARRAEMQALQSGNPRSPLLPQMSREVQAMEEEIARTRSALAGSDNSLVEKITAFEQLNLEKQFATEAVLSARRTLETARVEASRKSLFLAQVSQPNLPDLPDHMRFLRETLTVFAALFLAYSILWLILVNVREHQQA